MAAAGWEVAQRAVALDAGETRDLTVVVQPMQDVVVDVATGRIYLRKKVFFELDPDADADPVADERNSLLAGGGDRAAKAEDHV